MKSISFPELPVILEVFGIPLYFLPTWFGWNTRDRWPVFCVNLLFGWTAIGWIAAIVLAVRARNYVWDFTRFPPLEQRRKRFEITNRFGQQKK